MHTYKTDRRRPALLRSFVLGSVLIATGASQAGDPCTPEWFNAIGQPGIDAPGIVHALASYYGDVIAAGTFASIGGDTNLSRIARWSAAAEQWQSMGSAGSTVRALTVFNGDLVAAGDFTTIGGVAANRIARWDGTNWSAFGVGFDTSSTRAVTVYNNQLVAGGAWVASNGVTVNRIARWDGSAWQPLGSGLPDAVFALAVHNGELFAAGNFSSVGGVSGRVAKWNETSATWEAQGGALNGAVNALASYDGNLYAGGAFFATSGVTGYLKVITGATSNYLSASPNNAIYANGMHVHDGHLVVGGLFTACAGENWRRIARWNGASWSGVGGGVNLAVSATTGGAVYSLATDADGNLVVGGGVWDNVGPDALPANRIAIWGCPPGPTCADADVNCDGVVNVSDLLAVINAWGPCPAPPAACPADVAPAPDGDGVVNVSDLLAVINAWG